MCVCVCVFNIKNDITKLLTKYFSTFSMFLLTSIACLYVRTAKRLRKSVKKWKKKCNYLKFCALMLRFGEATLPFKQRSRPPIILRLSL